jgi:hypothetical protein
LPDKIAQRLAIFIGNQHCGKMTGPVTASQLQCVPPISLHAVSRLLRNQARRHHIALDSQLRQLSTEPRAKSGQFASICSGGCLCG